MTGDSRKARVSDPGLLRGAGDENRTRALSLGSDGTWRGGYVPTCADAVKVGVLRWADRAAVDPGCPILRARIGHGWGTALTRWRPSAPAGLRRPCVWWAVTGIDGS